VTRDEILAALNAATSELTDINVRLKAAKGAAAVRWNQQAKAEIDRLERQRNVVAQRMRDAQAALSAAKGKRPETTADEADHRRKFRALLSAARECMWADSNDAGDELFNAKLDALFDATESLSYVDLKDGK
jgi:hypothetical protein